MEQRIDYAKAAPGAYHLSYAPKRLSF